MLHISRILFPTDRSESAERAFVHAAFLAQAHGATLHAVQILERGSEPAPAPDLLPPPTTAASTTLDASHHPGALDRSTVIQSAFEADSPAGGILDYARREQIDLIVMGTHGRSGAGRLFAGSVAEEVVREAPCPVLTVREARAPSVRSILVPIDFSDRSRATIPVAEALAEIYGAAVELLFIIDEDEVPPSYAPVLGPVRVSAEEAESRFRKLMADLVRDYSATGTLTGTVRLGNPTDDIVEHARDHADLIVMSTHGHTGLKRLVLGSVAEKIVRAAPCPVLTVKSFGSDLLTAR